MLCSTIGGSVTNSTIKASGPVPILQIASQLGISESTLHCYGRYAAKLPLELIADRVVSETPIGHSNAKYIGVTAINPTPFGEGKTVVAIGLAMGLCRRQRRAIVTLREPSLAPVFGIKGGGAGGGRSRVLPSDEINLHFTGDLHAVAAANNLLAAMLDNHCQRNLEPVVSAESITWRRAIDMSDKGLAQIEAGRNHVAMAPRRETGFDLTAASEVMSILALATDLQDLRRRLGRIVVTSPSAKEVVTAEQIGAAGAMAVLLRQAIMPNLVQTSEHTPAIVHAGPFANISHGNSSVIADRMAMQLADYVVTESGFGSDLGAEKLFNLKCRVAGIQPAAEVLVCTIRSLKYHSGRFDVRPGRPLPDSLLREDLDALQAGIQNLYAHMDNVRQFGIPVVVAVNQFPSDTEAELKLVETLALSAGAKRVARIDSFGKGGEGALELSDAVIDACQEPSHFQPLYSLESCYEEKLNTIVRKVYGAAGVELTGEVRRLLAGFEVQGHAGLPVCIAKTQYSLSHDPKKLGRPTGFTVPVRDVRLSAGAGFVLAMTEGISLMPGLPRDPAARRIDIDSAGRIVGMGGDE